MEKSLYSVFKNTWEKLGLKPEGMYSQWKYIEYRYSDRPFHNLNHISYLIQVVKKPKGIFSAFYHDIFHDERQPKGVNEKKSANYAYKIVKDNGGSEKLADKIKKAILATDHDTIAQNKLGEKVSDADQAILASPWPTYAQYFKEKRDEKKFLSDKEYAKDRVKHIDDILKKKNIFYRHKKWEDLARANLKKERGILSKWLDKH